MVPATIAVVPAGYADGLDLRLAGRGFVLVSRAARTNRRCGQHGHDHHRRYRPRGGTGDEVVIIGEQAGDRIDVRELAATVGTIPWEVLCRIGSRIESVYS